MDKVAFISKGQKPNIEPWRRSRNVAYRNQNPSGRRPQRMTASADTAQEARVGVFRWPSMSILRSSVLPPWPHPSHHVASCARRVRDKEPPERVPVAEHVRMRPRYRVLEFLHSKLCDRARRRELPSDSEEMCEASAQTWLCPHQPHQLPSAPPGEPRQRTTTRTVFGQALPARVAAREARETPVPVNKVEMKGEMASESDGCIDEFRAIDRQLMQGRARGGHDGGPGTETWPVQGPSRRL